MDDTRADTVDLAFAVQGSSLPRDHRRALAEVLTQALPWLSDEPGAGVHRLNVAAGGGEMALLSQRTRLTLRLPRARVGDAGALAGLGLQFGQHGLRLGEPHLRELLPHSTLYAHFVATDAADEAAFLQTVQAQLAALEVDARAICGRRQCTEGGSLHGYGLMLDRLAPADALRVMANGLGPKRLWGCGLFVPHKSAAAVSSPH